MLYKMNKLLVVFMMFLFTNQIIDDSEWWKKRYEDDQLNEVIDRVLKNDSTYIDSILETKKALFTLSKITNSLLPSLLLKGQASIGTTHNDTQDNKKQSSISGEIKGNYELDYAGKKNNVQIIQNYEYEICKLNQQNAKSLLIYNTIEYYYKLSYINEIIHDMDDLIIHMDKVLEVMKQKREYGIINSQDDFINYISSFIQSKEKYIQLKTLYEESVRSLIVSLYSSKIGDKSYNSELSMLKNTKKLSDIQDSYIDSDFKIDLINNRNDVKIAKLNMQKVFKKIKKNEIRFLPTINLNGTISKNILNLSNPMNWLGMISIEFPLLDWLSIKNDVKISKAEYIQTKNKFIRVFNSAMLDIKSKYTSYDENRKLYDTMKQMYEQVLSKYNAKCNEHTLGLLNDESFTKLTNEYIDCKLQFLTSKYNMIKAELDYYRSISGV